MKVNRWACLAAGCLVQASAGLNYSFSILAPTFKEIFGHSDSQLASIAAAINLGGYFAILSGQVYERLQHRHNLGPRVVIWIGCILMVLGYGGMWLQASGNMPTNFTGLLVCGLLAGNAGTWWDTSILVTNVRNFPDDRGSVLGILKAFLGLSTSIYASMYWAAFAPPFSPSPWPSHDDLRGAAFDVISTAPDNNMWKSRLLSWVHSMQSMLGVVRDEDAGNAGAPSATAGPLAFLFLLAWVPSYLNLMGSLFINQVPREYHEDEALPRSASASLPMTPGNDLQAEQHLPGNADLKPLVRQSSVSAPDLRQPLLSSDHSHGVDQAPDVRSVQISPAHSILHLPVMFRGSIGNTRVYHHVNKEARFMGLYCLIAVLALLQAGSTLAGGQSRIPGSEVKKLQAIILIILLCLVLLVPVSAGPLLRQSLRKLREQQEAAARGHEHRQDVIQIAKEHLPDHHNTITLTGDDVEQSAGTVDKGGADDVAHTHKHIGTTQQHQTVAQRDAPGKEQGVMWPDEHTGSASVAEVPPVRSFPLSSRFSGEGFLSGTGTTATPVVGTPGGGAEENDVAGLTHTVLEDRLAHRLDAELQSAPPHNLIVTSSTGSASCLQQNQQQRTQATAHSTLASTRTGQGNHHHQRTSSSLATKPQPASPVKALLRSQISMRDVTKSKQKQRRKRTIVHGFEGDEESEEEEDEEVPPLQDLTSTEAISQPSFWALFFSLLAGAASGLSLLNNLAPLVLSLGGHKGGQVAFVSLFSVANASGRLLFGHLSEYYLHRSTIPRPTFIVISSVIMTASTAALMAGAPLQALYVLSLVMGFAFGGLWSAIPATASDLFGLSSFANVYCMMQFAPAIGTLVFASWLVGKVLSEHETDEIGYCVGLACFRTTWLVLSVLNLAALGVSTWLWSTTKHLYREAYGKSVQGGKYV